MDRNRSGEVRALYSELDELGEHEWAAALTSRGADDDVAQEVLELLRAGRAPAAIVERLAPEAKWSESAGPIVEGYRVGDELGDGASGRVFAATRLVDGRRVAIKILRFVGVEGDEAKRFRREVRILEGLDHPGIAGFVEAAVAQMPLGTAPALVMELVDGQPIHRHCDVHDLGDDVRVGLVAAVCDALVHAHERGVVHRDLKPANVLVLSDHRPVVVDFGVAHLAAPSEEDSVSRTRDGDLLGTLAYMAPEQATGPASGKASGQDSGAAGTGSAGEPRSDVYSAGALLFELLTGQHPIRLQSVSLTEAIQRISSVDARGLDEMRPDLAGDLSTILSRALAKDPRARYESAAMFGADLRRYLAREAIVAKPFGAWELAKRFARRHRAVTVAACAVFLGLVVGAVGLGVGLVQARSAQSVAERSAVETSEILGAVVDVLHAPFVEKRGHQVTVSELLDEVGPKLLAAEHFSPETAAAVHRSIGESLRSLGRPDEAREHLSRAVDAATFLGVPAPELARIVGERAEAEREMDDAALALDSLKVARALRVQALGEDALEVHQTDLRLAFALAAMGRYREAVRLAEETRDRMARTAGDASLEVYQAESIWGGILLEQSQYDESEAHIRSAIAGFKAHGEEKELATATQNLGVLLRRARRFPESLAVHEEALAQSLEVRGPEHYQTHFARGGRGMVRPHVLELEGARVDLQSACDGLRGIYGDRHEETLIFEEALSEVIFQLGEREVAVAMSGRVAAAHIDAGRKNNATVTSFNTHARQLMRMGDTERALEWLERARDVTGERHGRLSEYAITLDTNVCNVLVKLGRTEEALGRLEEIHGQLPELEDLGAAIHMMVKVNLGLALGSAGRHGEAVVRLREAVTLTRSYMEEGHGNRILVKQHLMRATAKSGQEREALELLGEIRAELLHSDGDVSRVTAALRLFEEELMGAGDRAGDGAAEGAGTID